MVYSIVRQTYMYDGSHYTICRGRRLAAEKFCRCPALVKKNSFTYRNIKSMLNYSIMNKKQLCKLLNIKTNKYLSHISESITIIIGLCIMHVCMPVISLNSVICMNKQR